MKRTVLVLAMVFTASIAAGHSGHAELAEASDLPGSATYGLDKAKESIRLAITFGRAEKAEKRLKFAEERLAEAAKLASQNQSGKATKAVKSYANEMEKVEEVRTELPERKQAELSGHINATRETRTIVLKDVMEKIPEQARQGIRTAMENSGLPRTPMPLIERKDGDKEGKSPSAFTATGRAVPMQ